MRIVRFCVALLGLICLNLPASAQEKYPNRPVKFVVSFAAGGSNDIIARVLCDWLSDHFGQQFVVENRTGASGNVGAQSVINSAPDGYTVMFVGPNNAISQSVFKKLSFDFIRDTAPVAGIMTLINIMVVPPSLPVKTVAEFVAYAKANPGKVNMASGGVGSSSHIFGELFKTMAGVDLVHVPYRGNYMPDLLAGQVQFAINPIPQALELVRTGKLTALAVTTTHRLTALPDMPTVAEAVPGYEALGWYALGAPKNTPAEIVDKLNAATNAALADPRLKARLADLGVEPMPMTPAEFGKFIAGETDKWTKVIKSAGVVLE